MLAALFTGPIVKAIAGSLFDTAANIFKAYQAREISREQALADLSKALVAAFAEVEKAHAEALAKTYESFQQTLRGSPELIRMFKVVIYSQTFVLFWSQWVVPMALWLGYDGAWRAGTTAEWAYLLIGGLCGAAPMLLRAGPGAGNIADRLKGLVKR
jgi:hypothetical protein